MYSNDFSIGRGTSTFFFFLVWSCTIVFLLMSSMSLNINFKMNFQFRKKENVVCSMEGVALAKTCLSPSNFDWLEIGMAQLKFPCTWGQCTQITHPHLWFTKTGKKKCPELDRKGWGMSWQWQSPVRNFLTIGVLNFFIGNAPKAMPHIHFHWKYNRLRKNHCTIG